MQFCSLGSGSGGNSFVVKNNKTILLVDCGFGLKDTVKRLEKYSIDPKKITSILITHEHEDHTKGVFSFANKFQTPVFLSYGTFLMSKKRLNDSYNIEYKIIKDFNTFQINDIKVTPIPVPHDAREPFQFKFESEDDSLAIITDLGITTEYLAQKLNKIKSLVIEFNHDKKMLKKSNYPDSLKKRINSRFGHLDNEESIRLIKKINHEGLKWIAAAHLSDRNNSPEIVNKLICKIAKSDLVKVKIIDQDNGLDWIGS
jgi:phosphoribosyl 1,2-cyclic phosphodiesterase